MYNLYHNNKLVDKKPKKEQLSIEPSKDYVIVHKSKDGDEAERVKAKVKVRRK